MLTFFHAPMSRSTAIRTLIAEMGIAEKLEMRIVTIPRADGSGSRDPGNPHPEGKAPALQHDGQLITERGAIMLHLCTLFPEAGLAPAVGSPEWGEFVTWLMWYQGVLEPVIIHQFAGTAHPVLTSTFREMPEALARIRAALDRGGPWLLGERFTAADILVHSPFAWFRETMPEDPVIRAWIERCMARPATLDARSADSAWTAAA